MTLQRCITLYYIVYLDVAETKLYNYMYMVGGGDSKNERLEEDLHLCKVRA